MTDKKLCVYLTESDWMAVVGCLRAHAEQSPPDKGATLWRIGRARVNLIINEIESKYINSKPRT